MPTSRAPHFFGLLGLALFATCTWSRPLFDHLNIKDPTFRTCGELSAPVRVHEVDLSPKLPYPGATLDINLHAISQGRTLEPMKVIRYSSYTPSSLYPPHEAPFPVPLPLPPSLPRRPPLTQRATPEAPSSSTSRSRAFLSGARLTTCAPALRAPWPRATSSSSHTRSCRPPSPSGPTRRIWWRATRTAARSCA